MSYVFRRVTRSDALLMVPERAIVACGDVDEWTCFLRACIAGVEDEWRERILVFLFLG